MHCLSTYISRLVHDDVIKWKHFPRYWPLVRGIHRPRWIPRTKASDAELWCFLHLNKRLSKQSWGWWFETPSCSLWRHMTIIVKKISHAVDGDNIWKHYEIFWEKLHIVFWCLIGTKPCKNDCLRSKLFPIAPVSKPGWHDSGLVSFEKNILSLNSKL